MAELREKKISPQEEFVEKVLAVRRVAKVVKGGRRFAFSALVVVGDRSGKVGYGLGKSRDVSAAISKASKSARSKMISVQLYKTTLPFAVQAKHGASKVLIRSAGKGTGVIAGGAVRAVMEAAGVKDVLAKSLGSNNPQNVVKATMKALSKLRSGKQIAAIRGKTIQEVMGRDNAKAK
ncbi:30S ribosomal protein S5 [Candidatus Babeliales bacterium]|nr:30S ribosomal protein S5 [Candidatus Babeliales bacterium]